MDVLADRAQGGELDPTRTAREQALEGPSGGPGPITRRHLLKAAGAGLGAVALGGALAACGSAASVAGSGSSTIGPGTKGSLTIWHYYNVPDQLNTLNQLTSIFQKKYPKVSVQSTYIDSNDIAQKVIAAANTQSGPDIIIYGGTAVSQMYQARALKNMQSYWKQYADASKFPDSVLTRFNGGLYAVKGYVNLTGFWYNKTLTDELGITIPKTFDEMTSAFAKVVASGKNYIPMALAGIATFEGDWTAWPYMTGYGFTWKNLSQSATESAYQLVQGWTKSGYVPKEAATWAQNDVFNQWTTGNVVFMENGNWQLGGTTGSKFEFGTTAMPSGPKGGTVYLGGEDQFIGAYSKNPDLAWTYLKTTFFSTEGNELFLKNAGSIPARTDVASSSAVTSNPYLSAFVQEVKSRGSEYPPEGGSLSAAQQVVAENWSSVIAGQSDPGSAAGATITGVKQSTAS